MGSVGTPQSWVPYENIKDCSQGFCSLYCPQWCYIIFPPPPPFEFADDDSGTNFSPLVIAIIGILASAFLLVSYYTVISKYCGNLDSMRRRNRDQNEESNENQNPSNQEPWQSATGLDEVLIKTITVCKYRKGDGLVEGTDCSVCLSEFQEDESLRLLPKCSHAFHLSCIDTWLKSHANCPLCRATIVCSSPPPLHTLPPVQQSSPTDIPSSIECEPENHSVNVQEGLELTHQDVSSSRSVRDLEENDTIVEIREDGIQQIRRSISMDMSRDRLSIADILCINQDEHDSQLTEDQRFQEGIGSSKSNLVANNKFIAHRSRVLHCVMSSPVTMKRSLSSGRFLFSSRHARSSRNLDISNVRFNEFQLY